MFRPRRFLRRTANRVRPAALVLLYHRVARIDTDPQWLAVPPETFDAQLELLRRRYRVLSLAELLVALRDDALPHRSVAITFDDGYADNLHQAKPLLEKHDVPATVFVASGFVGRREEFFWDELDRLLLQPGHLPREINLAPPHDGTSLASPMTCDLGQDEVWRWSLGDEFAHYTKALGRQHRGWNVLSRETPTPRHAAYRAVCAALAGSDPGTRGRWLDGIRAGLGVPAGARESHLTMTGEEVGQLAASGLVEVGAHTVGHPRLSSLPVGDQREEITQCKRDLEEVLGRPVTTFSYPFGNHADYTSDTVRLVREAGFAAACSNFGGPVRRGGDPFQLNRVLVRDWSPDELDGRLREWFLE